MISINHIAMYVRDLENMHTFYERYFGAIAGPLYRNDKTQFESYFLSFGPGTRLELMTRPETSSAAIRGDYALGPAHIAFSVGTVKAVNQLTATLHGDGYEIVSGPRTTGDGCYESCVRDPEGNLVEITV